MPTAKRSYIATAVAPARATSRPGAGQLRWNVPTQTAWTGGSVSLMVLGSRTVNGRLWLLVQLPKRPNGRRAWVNANRFRVRATRYRVRISKRGRLLALYRSGRAIARWRVVIGTPSTPTPVGRFAIYERDRQPQGSVLGPWALHLTAHSNVLYNYGGGPGRVALHGRSGPLLANPLGSAASHGCVRMNNSRIALLASRLPAGTPVRIVR